MSCDCPWFVNHRLACPHMLIILDQTMSALGEDRDISDLIVISHYHLKQSVDTVVEQATQFA